MNFNSNPKLTKFAQKLRREMTKEEKHLWFDFLKLLPVTFNRQKVVGEYILDFYCSFARLAIELDGSQHHEDEAMQKDKERDEYLNNLGITVLRYTNTDVNMNFYSVCQDILNHLGIKENII